MKRDPLISAWALLVALSALATAVSALRPAGPPWVALTCGAVILALACAKAQVILSRYLELAEYPGPLRAASTVLALWAIAVLALLALAG